MSEKIKIILIGGAPLSGKSFYADKLSKNLGIPWISTDDIKEMMQELVQKEHYKDLFYGYGMDAEQFYKVFKTPEKVFEMENRQSKDVQKGVEAMISRFYNWKTWIVEGIAITPEFVYKMQSKYMDYEIIPIFLYDNDENNMKERLYKRGLWAESNEYPDYIKLFELGWVILFNKFYKSEAAKYKYNLYNIEEKDIFDVIISSI